MTGKLYIVATPIGNLEDITLRALSVLKSVDLIACEDTRHTKILLDRHNIHRPLISYHQHSRLQNLTRILEALAAGQSVALVTDAGTPGISDPGNILVHDAVAAGIKVEPIPGPSALIALASVAGIAMDRFLFLGFLPHKKGRQTSIQQMMISKVPVIFYESTHRILKTLEALTGAPGLLVIGRELTKKFEEIVRGRPREVLEYFQTHETAGQFVVVYSPSDIKQDNIPFD